MPDGANARDDTRGPSHGKARVPLPSPRGPLAPRERLKRMTSESAAARLETDGADRTDEADRTRERLAFLSEAGAQLVETLDYETMLRNVAWLAVPRIADWCAVYLVLDTGRIEAVEVAHRDPERLAMAKRVIRRFPVDIDSPTGVGHVINTGKTEFVALLPNDPASETTSPAACGTQPFGLRCTITAPLAARGVVHGAITLANAAHGRAFTQEDVEVVREFAVRAALAIENARLYRETQEARRRAEASEGRSALLATVSEILTSSLDHRETLPKAMQALVRGGADWAFIDLATESGVRRAAAAHHDESIAAMLALEAAPAAFGDCEYQVLNVSENASEALTPWTGLASAKLLATAEPFAFASIPLRVRDRFHGRLAIGRRQGERPFSEAERRLGLQLASRVAIALENAFLYRQATDAIRVRDNLLSIASHELKTPLTSINLSIDLLRRVAERAPEDRLREEVFKRAESTWQQLQWLSSLVDELLDVTRINAGRLALRVAEFDLGELVDDVIERFEHQFEQAECVVSLDVTGDAKGEWDRARLEQVLVNLLTNAIKYGAGRPVEVRLEAGDDLTLSVRDFGIGLLPDDRERVFSPFERSTQAHAFQGLGLGLFITQHIVRSHRGSIECASDGPGLGATFTVRLPRRPPTSSPLDDGGQAQVV